MLRRPTSWLVGGPFLVLAFGCSTDDQEEREMYSPQIDAANFVTTVDNPFFPLIPGTTFKYESGSGETVEISVTHETKQVMGITCIVVRSKEAEDGELVEDTFDWYAQDRDGNVWYFGEDTKEYADGEVVSTSGSWEAGNDGAQPGLAMRGQPQIGDSYRQEYLRGVADDMGEVLSITESVVVPHGSLAGAVMTRDWTPLEPGVEERKYYVSGVGLVLEVEGDDEESRVELVSVTTERE